MSTVIESYVTFGVQYGADETRHVIHPLGMLGTGYAVIEAPDSETARAIAFAIFERKFSMIYTAEEFLHDQDKHQFWYPDGELLRISWQDREHLQELAALEQRLVFSDKPVAPGHEAGCYPDPAHPGYWICTEAGHPQGGFTPPDMPAELYNGIMAELLSYGGSRESIILANQLKNLYGASVRRRAENGGS